MKITCTKENLYKGLIVVSNLAGRNTTLPILNNILLKTESGLLTLQSTNLEIGVVTKVRGKVDEEGAITVQGRLFTELVSLLPNDKISLELEGLNLKISCAGHQSVVRGLSADDYPVIPEVVGKKVFNYKNQDLGEALNQVLLAVNTNENRPEISGILMILDNKKMTLVGTDSYRLAEKSIDTIKGDGEGKVIIPPKTAQQLIKVLSNSEGIDVALGIGDNQIMFSVDETVIVSRLISAQFPDYQQIIPKNFNTTVQMDKNNLLQAVKSAGLFTRSGINDVRFVIDADNKTMAISSANNQVGEDVSVLPLSKVTGQSNEIVFNYHYLLNGLEALASKDIELQVVDTNNPGLLKAVDDNNYIYIIMPIRQ